MNRLLGILNRIRGRPPIPEKSIMTGLSAGDALATSPEGVRPFVSIKGYTLLSPDNVLFPPVGGHRDVPWGLEHLYSPEQMRHFTDDYEKDPFGDIIICGENIFDLLRDRNLIDFWIRFLNEGGHLKVLEESREVIKLFEQPLKLSGRDKEYSVYSQEARSMLRILHERTKSENLQLRQTDSITYDMMAVFRKSGALDFQISVFPYHAPRATFAYHVPSDNHTAYDLLTSALYEMWKGATVTDLSSPSPLQYQMPRRRKTIWERIGEIRSLEAQGVADKKEIAKRIGVGPAYVSQLRQLLQNQAGTGTGVSEQVSPPQEVEAGAVTESPELSSSGVATEVIETRPKTSWDDKFQQIKSFLEDGHSVQDAWIMYGLSSASDFYSSYLRHLDWKSYSRPLTRTEIKLMKHRLKNLGDRRFDRLVRRGLTIDKIGDKNGVTRELVRQYIAGSGQYDYWKQSREHYRKPNPKELEYTSLLNLLNAKIQQEISNFGEDQWAEKKAMEYISSRKKQQPDNIPTEELVTIFRTYREAQSQGKPVSFRRIGQEVDMRGAGIRNIFQKVGLESLKWKIQRLSEEDREMIARSDNSEFSSNDIAYFTGIKLGNINNYRRPHPSALARKPTKLKGFSYSGASQIYEAKDLGFSRQEITELFNYVHPTIVDSALGNREKMEKIIIKNLRILYPEKDISKPYLN